MYANNVGEILLIKFFIITFVRLLKSDQNTDLFPIRLVKNSLFHDNKLFFTIKHQEIKEK